jgi:hypothetical protein
MLQGKRDPLGIGMGALSGYGGAQLGSTLSGFGATKAATPELASTAGMAGGTGGTPVAEQHSRSTIGATGGTTAGANTFGQATIYKSISRSKGYSNHLLKDMS